MSGRAGDDGGGADPFEGVGSVDERIGMWVDGCLSDRERQRFEAELRVSPALRRQLQEYEAAVADVREALNEPSVDVSLVDRVMAQIAAERATAARRPDTRPRSFAWAIAAAAAALALVAWIDDVAAPPARTATADGPESASVVGVQAALESARSDVAGRGREARGGETSSAARGPATAGPAGPSAGVAQLPEAPARSAAREAATVTYSVPVEAAATLAAWRAAAPGSRPAAATVGTEDARRYEQRALRAWFARQLLQRLGGDAVPSSRAPDLRGLRFVELPFDAGDPVGTGRWLVVGRPLPVRGLRQALAACAREVACEVTPGETTTLPSTTSAGFAEDAVSGDRALLVLQFDAKR